LSCGGHELSIAGFTNNGNNGAFAVQSCVNGLVNGTIITVNNTNGVSETHSGNATVRKYHILQRTLHALLIRYFPARTREHGDIRLSVLGRTRRELSEYLRRRLAARGPRAADAIARRRDIRRLFPCLA